MKIVIAGCGKVGRSIAEQLCTENHDVTVIDNNPERLHNLAKEIDVMVIEGSAINRETLIEAGCKEANLFIGLTGNDELNLLSALLAKRCGVEQTIVRVREPEYGDEVHDLARDLGISMIINPEQEAAKEIFRSLALPQSVSSEAFCSGKAEIFKVRVTTGSVLENLPVKDIPAKLHSNILACIVERNDKAYIPDGDFVLKPKDIVSITGNSAEVRNFFSKIHLKPTKIRRIMAVGAGKVAHYFCAMIRNTRQSLILIDNNPKVCEKAAQEQPHVTVIQGNGADERLLQEEGLEEMDAFISLTGMDEENIILSLYASQKAHIKTITKVNRIEFDELLDSLDLDTVINPKHLCADAIIRYVRAQAGGINSCVETVHKMAKDQVEALEFLINDPKLPIDIPLKDLALKNGTLVALIVRDNKSILPRGNDCLKMGDRIILITTQKGFSSLQDALKERSWI
ncbi:MAG: Trk system potassium transporter TrkA [Ileibacterium sp.]|nr:Trk system potassium transporter TrkA [Ileibacterium sp.]